MNKEITTLIDVLTAKADIFTHKRLYTFLENGIQEGEYRTYTGLQQKACAIGAFIQDNLKNGDRVLLLFPAGLDYIDAFFGTIFGGAMAVTAYPPSYVKKNDRLCSIIKDCQPAMILTNPDIYAYRHKLLDEISALGCIKWVSTETIDPHQSRHWKAPEIEPDSVAFLQYTSGSTAKPKGVMVSHKNLLANEQIIQQAFEHDETSTVVGWLPMYHDMGLIGNILQPLFIGSSCYLMSPFSFLKRPIGWLQAISKFRAHTSGGPNFAYEYLTETVREGDLKELDLSCWKLAFNGSEPIRHSTLEKFYEKFKPSGFEKTAFYPCYGLAEHTLFVCGSQKKHAYHHICVDQNEYSRNTIIKTTNTPAQYLVSSGIANQDNKRIIIVDPLTQTECADNHIGEIWILGDSVAEGYWANPEATEETFQAYTAETDKGPYLKTGDLGFIDAGDLFVTGRIKELIVLRGSNYYPTDIERIVENVNSSFKKGSCAAFSTDIDNEEHLIIVQEIKRKTQINNYEQVVGDIRQALLDDLGITPYEILFLNKDSIPKTTSGKIQRFQCRELYHFDQFNIIHRKIL